MTRGTAVVLLICLAGLGGALALLRWLSRRFDQKIARMQAEQRKAGAE